MKVVQTVLVVFVDSEVSFIHVIYVPAPETSETESPAANAKQLKAEEAERRKAEIAAAKIMAEELMSKSEEPYLQPFRKHQHLRSHREVRKRQHVPSRMNQLHSRRKPNHPFPVKEIWSIQTNG